MPKIIGIRFSDNDFSSTVRAFLKCMLDSIENCDADLSACYPNLNKEKIVKLFNLSAPGLYWIVQNRLRYDKSEQWEPSNYLTIKEEHVFFDNEVTEYIKQVGGWENGEFHVLDTQAFKPHIYSI